MKKRSPNHIIASLIKTRQNDRDMIMNSILVAIGVNILSSGIVEIIAPQNKGLLLTIIGLLICAAVAIHISYSKYRMLNRTSHLEGVFIYNRDQKTFVPVFDYGISENMRKYLFAACAENKALKKNWESDELNPFRHQQRLSKEQSKRKIHHSKLVLMELLEYCVIEKLSIHLTDYFNSHDDTTRIQEYERNSIPDILLQNRFLRLFSENMDNREAFAESHSSDDCDGKVVYAMGENGAIYSYFSLVLPKGSKVYRNNDEVVIDMPLLTLSLRISFDGMSTVLERGFEEHYLKIARLHEDHDVYKFSVDLAVKFKVRSLLSKGTSLYYGWIDSFIDALTEFCSFEHFMANINWTANYTLIRCLKQANIQPIPLKLNQHQKKQ